ncbi:Nicotinamide mononucleotide adenylyltransferase 1 [Strongyloides ratti]|uniref:Nicotinamide mononucleotide adenylyltransferase 1 n=1 Tax=Strongyloides ratti TaxID=34506 RepID=A0A090KRG4_STRRB|nr:Nicotinamide mononucleotide adenylyltransferase 1 [Strongyloides ratti]CEF60094.1 Nicotinamide mononucleotide adenylyltransferase 1 [Strongyloides ratti]
MNNNETTFALLLSDVCNPPTYLHLRILECAKNYVNNCMKKHATEGILHVNNFFPSTTQKEDCISNDQRFKLSKLCCRRSKWIRADNWKVNEFSNILSYFINLSLHYQKYYDNEFGKNVVKIIFICDNNFFTSLKLIDNNSFLEEFLNMFSMIVVSIDQSQKLLPNLLDGQFLEKHKNNLFFVDNTFNTQFSTSQQVRDAIKRNETIRYCTENDVVDYIEKYMLYKTAPRLLKNESQNYNNIQKECIKKCSCNNKINEKEKILSYNIMTESYPNHSTFLNYQKEGEPIWTSLAKPDYKKSKSLENIFYDGQCTPIYDNLRIDEMLKANEHWVSEMLKQADELEFNIKVKPSYSKKVSFTMNNNKDSKINVKDDNLININSVETHNDNSNKQQNDINDVEKFLSMYDSLNLSTKAKLSNIQTDINELKISSGNKLDTDYNNMISLKNTKANKNNSIDRKNFALESTV